MTLHRRIIRSLSSADDAELCTICRQAAQTRLILAMRFVQSLRPEHHQSFWYSASTYNFVLIGSFVSLLWATSCTAEEAAEYRKKLDEYKWMLRISSKSADFLGRALALLNTSTVELVNRAAEEFDARGAKTARPLVTRDSTDAAAGLAHLDTVRSTPPDLAFVGAEVRDSTRGTPLDATSMDDHSWFQALTESGFDGA
jgi:hypothetical protein